MRCRWSHRVTMTPTLTTRSSNRRRKLFRSRSKNGSLLFHSISSATRFLKQSTLWVGLSVVRSSTVIPVRKLRSCQPRAVSALSIEAAPGIFGRRQWRCEHAGAERRRARRRRRPTPKGTLGRARRRRAATRELRTFGEGLGEAGQCPLDSKALPGRLQLRRLNPIWFERASGRGGIIRTEYNGLGPVLPRLRLFLVNRRAEGAAEKLRGTFVPYTGLWPRPR